MIEREMQQAVDGSPATVTRYEQDLYPDERGASGTPLIEIRFQCGPVAEAGRNGAQIEHVIDVLVARLDGFQRGPFRCRENALAITKLEEAKHWLLARTRARQAQGVEGTNRAHAGAAA